MNNQAIAWQDGLERLRERVQDALARIGQQSYPPELYEPVRYVLQGGGKRLRPLLVLLTAGAWGASEQEAMPAALAVEVFHTFTLVHDDIMDQSAERRGRPTVHVRWGVPEAILCGDWLMGKTYELLNALNPAILPQALAVFADTFRRLCEGQAMDMAFETQEVVSLDAYLDMIARKTGALLEASLVLGGLIGGVATPVLNQLKQAGWHLGQAFQVQDDLLDIMATDSSWGKPVGGDLREGKKTYIVLKMQERASVDDLAFFKQLIGKEVLSRAEIREARDRLMHMGVLEDSRRFIESHYKQALDILHILPENEPSYILTALIRHMQARMH